MKYNAVINPPQFSAEETDEPLTLAEAKEWCKIELDITEENTLITELITTARKQCEGYLNISLIERTVTVLLNNSLGGIELPYGPVAEFTSLENEDEDVLVEDNDYVLQGLDFKFIKKPCECYLKAVYNAGYAVADVPKHFKTAILKQVAYLYENRGDVKADTGIYPVLKQDLKPYRRVW